MTPETKTAHAPIATTLTKRQREVLDYVTGFTREHGYAPTLTEIGNHFGFSSLATTHKHLEGLRAKGFINRRFGHPRSAVVAKEQQVKECAEELLEALCMVRDANRDEPHIPAVALAKIEAVIAKAEGRTRETTDADPTA